MTVARGTTVLGAARGVGIEIPTLCHVEGLAPAGSCSLCSVQVEGRPNLWPACALPAAEGMVVWTDSAEVRSARRTVLELLLSDHVGDCIGPCRTGCPARLDIPGFIGRIAAEDAVGAWGMVTEDLTLPASLGRVCPRLCEQRCRRLDLEDAVSIRNLHRFAADQGRALGVAGVPERGRASGKRVAIVGAGPAGLAAAYHLVRRGHEVAVYDAHPEAGGMLRYGIPEFRLPRSVLDAEIGVIRQMGVEFRLGTRLGGEVTLAGLRSDYDAVFLALGAQGSRGLGCVGEELATPALAFLEQITLGQRPAVGREAVIVGGGNTAMDASRCAVRMGAESVRVHYRRTRREMPCLLEEVEAAEAEGVRVEYLVAPVRLERDGAKLSLTCQRMELGPPDESGRARPVPVRGSEFVVPATCVIAAIGQAVDFGAVEAAGLAFSKWGIAADPHTLATNLEGVFAGGDAVSGPDLAVRAVAAGKRAAVAMDRYLSGVRGNGAGEPLDVLMGQLDREELAIFFREARETARTAMPHLGAGVRGSSFAEVELGFEAADARREAQRCLRCGCGKAVECRLRRYATEYGADPVRFVGARRFYQRDATHREVIFESGKCIMCGACVQVAAQAGERVGVSFVAHGFEAGLAVPFGGSMADGLQTTAQRAVEVCPTGALVLKRAGARGQGCPGNEAAS